jgi:hypothetical protein
VRIAFCILFRSSVISKSNGLDLANFTKSACFKTLQVRYRILRNGHFLSHRGCSKTRNQLRGSTFHSWDIYCLFNIVRQYQSIHCNSFHFSLCQSPFCSKVFSKLVFFYWCFVNLFFNFFFCCLLTNQYTTIPIPIISAIIKISTSHLSGPLLERCL